MDRRRLLQTTSIILTSGIFAGCTERSNENTDSEGDETNSNDTSTDDEDLDDQDEIDADFTVIDSRCSTSGDVDAVNTATINFDPAQERISIHGVIADGKPNKSAELRETLVDWGDDKVTAGVGTTENEGNTPVDCPTKTEYCLTYDYLDQLNQKVWIKPNGVLVATAEPSV